MRDFQLNYIINDIKISLQFEFQCYLNLKPDRKSDEKIPNCRNTLPYPLRWQR